MKYTLKDFYSVQGLYYIPQVNKEQWFDEETAKQIVDKLNEDLTWEDYMASQDLDEFDNSPNKIE